MCSGNNIIFNELNIFNKLDSNKIYYSATFNLDEKNINDNNLINLVAFSDYEIDLEVESKGYFDIDSKNLKNLNKYIFKKSSLITNTDYLIKNIDLVKLILKIFKKKKYKIGKKVKIKFVKDRPGHDKRYAINSNKVKKQLKWKPRVNFKEGLKKNNRMVS